MFAVPNLTNMKNLLRSTVLLAAVSLLLFFGCTPEEDESFCNCEKVFYIESKYQEQITDIWLLNYVETTREPTECQNETSYSIPPIGSSIREVYRVECN